MRKVAILAATLVAICSASPVFACMANPYPNAIVFANPPSSRPTGSVLLKVERLGSIPHSYSAVYRVSEGPLPMVGRAYRIAPDNFSSCTGFGSDRGYVAVFASPREKGADTYLPAVTFERSWRDYFLSFLGWRPYRYAGNRVVPLKLETGDAEG